MREGKRGFKTENPKQNFRKKVMKIKKLNKT